MPIISGGGGGAVAREDTLAKAFGVLSQSWDLNVAPTSNTLSFAGSGEMIGALVGLNAGDVVTNICMGIHTAAAGTTPTLMQLGLYTAAGVQVAATANLATNAIWTSTGLHTFGLTTPYTVKATGGYYAVLVANGAFGTTQPAFAANNGIVVVQLNPGAPAALDLTPQTTLPASFTPASAQSAFGRWFGVS